MDSRLFSNIKTTPDVERTAFRELLRLGIPRDVASRLLDQISTARLAYEGEDTPKDEDEGLELVRSPAPGETHGYAIRDADLELVKGLLGAVPGLAGLMLTVANNPTNLTSGTLGPAILALATGLLTGGFSLYWSGKNKGAELSPKECAVLVALKTIDDGKGASEAEVARYLAVKEDDTLGKEDLKTLLTGLTEVTLRNGTKAPFIHVDRVTKKWVSDV